MRKEDSIAAGKETNAEKWKEGKGTTEEKGEETGRNGKKQDKI